MALKKTIYINLVRITKNGTGLTSFSLALLKCVERCFHNAIVLAPKQFEIPINLQKIKTPSFLAITSNFPRIRALLCFLYFLIYFPKKNKLFISTTHHGIPFYKDQIITIHDLRPFFHPDNFLQKMFFRHFLPFIARGSKGIFTVSNYSKKMLIKYYRIPSEKIFVIPNHIDTEVFSPKNIDLNTKKKYLLMVGASLPTKNVPEVLHYSFLWKSNYNLKILCNSSSYRKKLNLLAKNENILKYVELLDFVEKEKLVELYRDAVALIYPSIIEGFGIPPLEAMACGTPTIVSDIEVFREIYGEAPIYVQLGNKESWEEALLELKDKELVKKKIRVGLEISKNYPLQTMCRTLQDSVKCIWP